MTSTRGGSSGARGRSAPRAARAAGSRGVEARRIVESLRKVIRRAAPGAEESVVWGALSYHRPWIGGRVKGAICQVVVKRDQVRLDFIHGIRLPDPRGLLRGDGVSKRYVPIPTVGAARSPAIAALIEAAAEVIPAEL